MTITEALAEIKTISKRIDKKNDFILEHLCRQSIIRDPLEKEGGSQAVVAREMQSAHDLAQRIVALRSLIARSNQETKLTVGDVTKSVADWIIWRREVAPLESRLLSSISNRISAARKELIKQGFNLTEDKSTSDKDILVNVKELEIAEEREKIDTILGELDGKLSLLNATTHIG